MIVAQTELGRGVLGVVDGASPLGVETDVDIAWRKDLLRKDRLQAVAGAERTSGRGAVLLDCAFGTAAVGRLKFCRRSDRA